MRILCVDDEPYIRDVLQKLLSGENEVVCVSDGCAARDRLLAGEDYDAIVCDVLMPNCTGMDLYRALEESRPEMCKRMIFLTGGFLIPAIEKFVDETRCVMVDKPFSLKDLETAIEKVTGKPLALRS